MKELTKNEKIAFETVQELSAMAYLADEIVREVANDIGCSVNSAKGYIGQLVKKGYVKAHTYSNGSSGKVKQFTIVNH